MAQNKVMVQAGSYCVCKQGEAGFMIECIRNNGGCGGWVHPECCGLELLPEELEALDGYICPLCEQPGDDESGMKAMTTRRANKHVKKSRKKEKKKKSSRKNMEKKSSIPWTCSNSGMDIDGADLESSNCLLPMNSNKGKKEKKKKKKKSMKGGKRSRSDSHDKRRSQRDSSKVSSYIVPESDDDLGEEDILFDEDGRPKKKSKRSKKSKTKDETPEIIESSVDNPELLAPSAMVIDKILGRRIAQGGVSEYYIKWKGFSYMHASWEREETLLSIDPNNKNKLRRFEEKRMRSLVMEDEDEYFSPDFCEVHRIIAEKREDPYDAAEEEGDTADDGIRYLVKWRTLPYAECTWERACDLDNDAAVEMYKSRETMDDEGKWDMLPHPTLRDYKKVEESPAFGQDGSLKLRAYQLEGLNWLIWNFYNKRASILADEMGLGKTIQTLAFVYNLTVDPKTLTRGPFLVVAPLSLIQQWQNECETWTDMNCVVYHGNSESRELIYKHEFFYLRDGKSDKKKPHKFNILVTTYEIAIKDIRILSHIHWRCLIVDEAHRLKNQSSRLTEQLRGIQRDHCVLLTGTPLQNRTEELWALLNFIDQHAFPSIQDFLEKFGDLQDSSQVAALHNVLKPYLLRRVKEDVEKSLPPKEETIIEVELTSVQKQWYRAIYERNTQFLYKGGATNNAPNLMNVMMELRKCCNHPYLNNGVEDRLVDGIVNDQERHDLMVKCSGKLVLIDKLLPKLKEGGHKILVFSQMVRVLDILEDYLRFLGYSFERLDGNIRGNERQAAIDRFVKPEYNRFLMLLSTKAGGLGLNLTAADTVIIFDSDWNPQNDLQAQARAHRIGQLHSVKIYRLITRKTYEMHMFHRASLKLGLDKAVLTHMRKEQGKEKSDKGKRRSAKAQEAKEIDELLRRGAYDVFREDDTAADQFCAADIDQILQRSTQIVQYAQEAQSSFSKASFVAAEGTIDIDDPDFWKKAVGLDEPEPVNDDADLILDGQRRRNRVQRFGEVSVEYQSDEDIVDDIIEETTEEVESQRKEPREWTINGRDRLQRALLHFGFGRWDKIRSQSGGSRALSDIEGFARAFVLQCGLCCGESSSGKEDSTFVKGAIQAAESVKDNYFGGGSTLPAVLTDPDFTSKLKQGAARRALVRLDMLLRLHTIITQGLDRLVATGAKTVRQQKKIVALEKRNDVTQVKEELKETQPTEPRHIVIGENVAPCINPDGDAEMSDASQGDNSDVAITEADKSTPEKSKTEEGKIAVEEMEQFNSTVDEENDTAKDTKTEVENTHPEEVDTNVGSVGPPSDGGGIVSQDGMPIDDRVRLYTDRQLLDAIELVDLGERPSWSRLTPWWTVEEDKNMLLGVFFHGYGRCSQILADPRLSFFQKAEAARMEQELGQMQNLAQTSLDTRLGTVKNGNAKHDARVAEKKIEGADDEIKDEGTTESTDCMDTTENVNDESETLLDGKGDPKTEGGNEQKSDHVGPSTGFQMPEVQQMNRLLLWLLQAEEVRRQKEEEAERRERDLAEKRREELFERRQREAALRRAQIKAVRLVQMDMFRHEAFLYNQHAARAGLPPLQPTKDWSADERRSLGYVLAALGAPSILEQATRSRDELSWENVVEYGQLRKTPAAAKKYFNEKFMPKCTSVAAMKIDPTSEYADGLVYIDCAESTVAHGMRAKRLAMLCLRRIKLLKVVRSFVKEKKDVLREYFKSDKCRDVEGMPIWWCPWIHDKGLLAGASKYGISAWKQIRNDTSLPFHQAAVQSHIRAVFLQGCDSPYDTTAVAAGVFDTHAQLYCWFRKVREEFPSVSKLEERLQHICHVLTKDLGPDDPGLITEAEYLDIPPDAFESSSADREKKPNETEQLTEEIKKLGQFIQDSGERRKEYLSKQRKPLAAAVNYMTVDTDSPTETTPEQTPERSPRAGNAMCSQMQADQSMPATALVR